jgi:hypothetical protein
VDVRFTAKILLLVYASGVRTLSLSNVFASPPSQAETENVETGRGMLSGRGAVLVLGVTHFKSRTSGDSLALGLNLDKAIPERVTSPNPKLSASACKSPLLSFLGSCEKLVDTKGKEKPLLRREAAGGGTLLSACNKDTVEGGVKVPHGFNSA